MDFTENQYNELWLKPFRSSASKIEIDRLIGSGSAGFVFKVTLSGKCYALKLFKFYYPEIHPTKLQGTTKRAYYDSFLVECRANGSIIDKGMNGIYTAFCYGWMKASFSIENRLAWKFNISQLTWDRPPGAEDKHVRGIFYEYIEGSTLADVNVTPEIAQDVRAGLRGLHKASIAHGDIRASNILVQNNRVKWVDLSTSKTLPHIKMSPEELTEFQEKECSKLEIGFVLLSKLPINQELCVADLSLTGMSSINDVLTEYDSTKRFWAPAPSLEDYNPPPPPPSPPPPPRPPPSPPPSVELQANN